MAFSKVAAIDDIPKGTMKGFDAKGVKFLIANVNGKFYAIGSVCTHMGGPLEEGVLNGKLVTCPWHGSAFDVTTGKVKEGPAQKDEPKYKVKIDGKNLLVDVG